MRHLCKWCFGFTFALSSGSLSAQSPAATLGPIRVIEDQPTITTVRAQSPEVRPAPMAPMNQPLPVVPVQSGALGQPRPVPNPMVTEIRDINGNVIPHQPMQPYHQIIPSQHPGYIIPSPQPGYVIPPPAATMQPGVPTVVTQPPAVIPGSCPPAGGCGPCGTGLPLVMDDPYLGSRVSPRRMGIFNRPVTERFSLTAEYLLWYVRDQESPPLLTTSDPAFNGIIGQGNTRSIFGGDMLGRTLQSGGRFWANYWFPGMRWGLDGGVYFLGRVPTTFTADSSSYPLLARPFVSANTGRNSSELIAFPGLAIGSGVISHTSSLFGTEANLRRSLWGNQCNRLDALIGFKNFNLFETLRIQENVQRLPTAPANVGNPNQLSATVTDQFRTENHFYGVNMGLAGEIRRGRWYASGRATVGLGTIYQQAEIMGSQVVNTTTGLQQFNGGLYAIPGANIGTYSQSKFAVMPEVGLTLGYYITPNLRFGVGYNFLYLNSVLRPTGTIDTVVDETRIPNFGSTATPLAGRPRPAPLLNDGDFFAQGINFSLQWTW